jgi:uncharacterized damage-inducible protein DinB
MSMTSPSLTAEDILAWNDATAKGWHALALEHPTLLQIPCDIHNSTTVGQLLQHIVAAELRYAERLSDAPATDYTSIPFTTADEIFATHQRALDMLKALLQDSEFDWNHEIEFPTLTAGKRRAARKAVFQHALLHSIRHYAQLATLVRQHGLQPAPADYLLLASRPA